MAERLSYELVYAIAEYLDEDTQALINGVLVCRRWKAPFEAVLYQKIYLIDGCEPNGAAVSLAAFKALTATSSFEARRGMVREIHILVAVPNSFTELSPEIEASAAGRSEILARLERPDSVKGSISSFTGGLEPDFYTRNESADNIAPITDWTPRISGFQEIELSTLYKSWSRLYEIPDRVLWRISNKARNCRSLTLELNPSVEPEAMGENYKMNRRQVIAGNLGALSSNVLSLVLTTRTTHDLSFLDLKTSPNDSLTITLRDMSIRLYRLELTDTALPLDFWSPEPGYGISNTSLHWPDLHAIYVYRDPALLHIENVLIPSLPDDSREGHDLMDILFISLGHAAQRMPHIEVISYAMGLVHPSQLYFSRGDRDDAVAEVSWSFESNYFPTEQVATAWQFPLEDLVTVAGQPPKHEATYSVWPPAPLS
ncbi:hypothetical protein BJX64DRAFT_291476 [Aspergillus heterothallicus]